MQGGGSFGDWAGETHGALGGTRTHGLILRRDALYPSELQARVSETTHLDVRALFGAWTDLFSLVPKEGLEPTRPFRALHPECSASTNSATSACTRCSPDSFDTRSPVWWAVEGSNLGPLACEASALTTELTARLLALRPIRPFSTFMNTAHASEPSIRWWQRLDSNQ